HSGTPCACRWRVNIMCPPIELTVQFYRLAACFPKTVSRSTTAAPGDPRVRGDRLRFGSVEVGVEGVEGEDVLPGAHHGPVEFGFGVEPLRPGVEGAVDSVRHRQRRFASGLRLRVGGPPAGGASAGGEAEAGGDG